MKRSSSPLTKDSTIGALYATPVGHDILAKLLLQLGISPKWITNSLISRLSLKRVEKIAGSKLDPDFLPTLLQLVNQEKDLPAEGTSPITKAWWKEAVFYQIYPRSFMDADGDGVGDLKGILSKLDYLKDLGVGALWLSPIYDSPNDDNGYDIRDYRKIMTDFGTMEDFDLLLSEVHKRGMRLIMDLVVNHTSDEHLWFQKALEDPKGPYGDYYFLEEGADPASPPGNWVSFFSGSAWKYFEKEKLWALHLFSQKQMDLNWDNPALRQDIADMVSWWLDKGVDGFRMDVINYISKERTSEGKLPQGNETIGNLMTFTGIEHYYYGPHLHDYLKELHERAFAPHKAFSVGETPGLGMKMCQLITGEERGELDMVFSFDQLETPGHTRFEDYLYDLNYYRDYITDWMLHYGNQCRMSLFYDNHDNPRMVSKVTKDPSLYEPVAMLLAGMQFTLRGTPFIFQGDEMGLVNYPFSSMEEITDVESTHLYAELLEKGKTPAEAFAVILSGTREHARVLLPWNKPVSPEHLAPVDKIPTYLPQEMHPEVTAAYKALIALRASSAALIYGEFEVLNRKKDRFVYKRWDDTDVFVIECNLGRKEIRPVFTGKLSRLVFRTADYDGMPLHTLGPYEIRIWKKTTSCLP
ncbi:MAG: alpha-glucosidase [Lachnospiraceae bacterium]|nr:alpha-glucosidase [Lachnospiraceae bacterium]